MTPVLIMHPSELVLITTWAAMAKGISAEKSVMVLRLKRRRVGLRMSIHID